MDWHDSKWCSHCGAAPMREHVYPSSPTIELWKCGLCGTRFEFDTWTKAARELPSEDIKS